MRKERAESSFHIELYPLGDVRVDPEVEPPLLRVAEAALPVPPLQLRAAAVDDDAVQRTGLQPEGLKLRQDLAEPGWRANNVDCPFSKSKFDSEDQKRGTYLDRSGTRAPLGYRPAISNAASCEAASASAATTTQSPQASRRREVWPPEPKVMSRKVLPGEGDWVRGQTIAGGKNSRTDSLPNWES